MHNTWKGVPVPDAGDDLLGSYETGLTAAGIIIPAASVAAARVMLAAAEAAGVLPSAAHPAYFDIGSNIYRSVGTKGTNNVFDLKMINEPDFQEDNIAAGAKITGVSGQVKNLITSTLPTRPYRRTVLAWAMVDAQVSGVAGLKVVVQGGDGQSSRWETNSDMTTQTAMNMRSVEAGVAPDIRAQISFGGSGLTSTVTCGTNTNDLKLGVIAWPVSML